MNTNIPQVSNRSGPDYEPVWHVDPSAASLAASDAKRERGIYPESFDAEAGRRLLLAQMTMSSWILRRVEKVDIVAEQAVRRRITIEFLVPDEAPLIVTPDGRRLRCVPLSTMRRRTLIGLDIRDEQQRSVSLPGLRLTQTLDQSLLVAAARPQIGDRTLPGDGSTRDRHKQVLDWVKQAVCGTLDEVRKAYAALNAPQPTVIPAAVRDDPLFRATAERLRHNFTLYVFLDETEGRHRLLHMAFEEPTDWRYQKPELEPIESPDNLTGQLRYTPGRPRLHLRHGLALLGLRSTRIRFQVPGADSAASFHFELSAPDGVQVVQAILLAGRPNEESRRPPPFDHVRGHSRTVGLHVIEVPNVSLCRVQANLRVVARGWLSTMAVASFAIAALMFTVMLHAERRSALPEAETTNAILFLVTAVAAAAALVAQPGFTGVAVRFVAGIRALVTFALGLPIVTAGFLGFRGKSQITSDEVAYTVIKGLTTASAVIFLLTFTAWAMSRYAERHQLVEESPWDMSRPEPDVRLRQPGPSDTFKTVAARFAFDKPAVGVASAEGWHSVYGWDDEKQHAAVVALRGRTP